MIKSITYLLFVMALLALFSCSSNQELPTVKELDISKYAGTWYEIARMPSRFEDDLKCVTATYTPLENGKIEVLNRGVSMSNGKLKEITGSAKVPDAHFPGQLKVTFFWPFAGNYYVIDCAEDYAWALVGDPSRKYLWILNRESTLEKQRVEVLLKKASELGFDVKALQFIEQDCPDSSSTSR